ncbi:MAG: type II toxin-antitoxin system PemK/MazF family toxin [Bacteroidia bacterium]|jgi:mRNA interferase MazF|nr:type II toxin-antitoxin system PemK/MazF family toxin [Bacteroidia bacterium]
MKEGMITVLALPQANGEVKKRPVLLLKALPRHNDFLVCGISTQLQQEVKGIDLVFDNSHPDFKHSGLKSTSLLRLLYIAVVNIQQMPGSIGKISPKTLQQMQQRLGDFIKGN